MKCDGKESDPYAILTLLDLDRHADKPAVKELITYFREKGPSAGVSSLANLLPSTDAPTASGSRVALIISERFINMPHAVVPPLYQMLAQEVAAAAASDPASFTFTHYLILSKTYTEVASQLDAEPAEQGASKKSKKAAAASAAAAEVFYFHPEDEALHRHAVGKGNFEYTKQGDEGASDAKRAFQELGVRPQGHLILLEAGKLDAAVKGVAEYIGSAE